MRVFYVLKAVIKKKIQVVQIREKGSFPQSSRLNFLLSGVKSLAIK